MMIVDCQQGTPDWFAARAGVVTASMFSTARDYKKNGDPSSKQLDYAMQVAVERIAGETIQSTYETWQMRRGSELEMEARSGHSFRLEKDIIEVGFVRSDCGRFGGSPDDLIDDDGGAEYKCPIGAGQLRKIFIELDKSDYLDQVQGNMWITGRQWWELVIYCPFLSPAARLFTVTRYDRDQKYIDDLAADLEDFDKLVNEYKTTLEKGG